jgi:hypothetical protein
MFRFGKLVVYVGVVAAVFVVAAFLVHETTVDEAAAVQQQAVLLTPDSVSGAVAFTENQGQWDERVLFRATSGGCVAWFTTEGVCYEFSRRIPEESEWGGVSLSSPLPGEANTFGHGISRYERMTLEASFVGANASPRVIGEETLDYKCNYFSGKDRDKWRTNVPNYRAIRFEEVYPGIDLRYYGNGGQLEYDFIVSPGADPSRIRVAYRNANSLSVNTSGALVIETEWGVLLERRPCVYQQDGDLVRELEGDYVLFDGGVFGFRFDSGYDRALALVIDPVIEYSTFLGGSGTEEAHDIELDRYGNVYVTGRTGSLDFPIVNPVDTAGRTFVTKFSPDLQSIVYSTYIGGTYAGRGIAVDTAGNTYVAGNTRHEDLPVVNPYDSTYNGSVDIFVAKLNAAGDALVYCTYIGSDSLEGAEGIAIDPSGNGIIAGHTLSSNFPTVNPFDSTLDGWGDAIVIKLGAGGDSLLYSTYLGGFLTDRAYGVAVDADGNAYVTGESISDDFPFVNPYIDAVIGPYMAFLTKIHSSGDSLIYSTFLGGIKGEKATAVAVDASGHAYVTGYTESPDFPTVNAFQDSLAGDLDAFVTKFSISGDSLIYSTYLGGGTGIEYPRFPSDISYDIAVDDDGNVYIVGHTFSIDFPLERAQRTGHRGNFDEGFVAKLSAAGNKLVYSTYLGGGQYEGPFGIAVDSAGRAYVVGETYWADYPTYRAYDSVLSGGRDAFVTRITEDCCGMYTDGHIRGNANCDMDGKINMSDLTKIIDRVYVSKRALCCEANGDITADGKINLMDITVFVSYLYLGGNPPLSCP